MTHRVDKPLNKNNWTNCGSKNGNLFKLIEGELANWFKLVERQHYVKQPFFTTEAPGKDSLKAHTIQTFMSYINSGLRVICMLDQKFGVNSMKIWINPTL